MKQYIIKSLGLCALGLLMLSQVGCSDFLDQKPQGQWVDGDNAGGSYQTDVFSLYARAKGWGITSGLPVLAIHSFRSEDAEKGSSSTDGAALESMYDNFEYLSDDGELLEYWNKHYELVITANKIFADMEDAEKAGATLSDADLVSKGEAHFFRAYAYFDLVRAFGDIRLFEFKVTDAAQTNIAKSPASEVYALIDKDLTEAKKLLPLTWPKSYTGRLTTAAAAALHAKTYITRNSWANAYAVATEVISSPYYNLNTSFEKIFRETGENCSESILEWQCMATKALPESSDIGSSYSQIQGVRGAGQWDLGWGFNTPTQELANAFEANDPRKDETLLYFSKVMENDPDIPANKPWGEKPYTNNVVAKYYNKKTYTNPEERAKYAKFGHWMNIRMLRLSEMYLIAAEAANEMGGAANTTKALEYLEAVRARARAGNSAILPKVTTTDQALLRKAIRHERRIELAMEWDHFYDLVRWGTAKDVLNAAGKPYQDKHALLPLPQSEVKKSNGKLIQNPNY